MLMLSAIVFVMLTTQLKVSKDTDNYYYGNDNMTTLSSFEEFQILNSTRVVDNRPKMITSNRYEWPYHWVDTSKSSNEDFTPAIKVLLPSYSVSETYDSNTCRGQVLIKLDSNKCDALSKQTVSHNTTWDSYLKRVYGPDHYRLMYEGAEKIMAIQHTENCTTRLFYSFTLPGEYKPRLKIELSEYWGVNEVVHNTAHWKNKELAWLKIRRCATVYNLPDGSQVCY